MTTLYGINNCDTIKKVRRWLDQKNIDYVFHDYKKVGCQKNLATEFLEHFDLETVVNKRGTSWRKLPDATKNNLTKSKAVQLMTENPSLIKRPILQHEAQWLIGFDKSQWQSILE